MSWLSDRYKLDFWPEHVQLLLAAAAEGLGTRPLTPGCVEAMSRSPFPGHEVTWFYFDAEEIEQDEGVYGMEVVGGRFGGRWDFRQELLETLLAAARKN